MNTIDDIIAGKFFTGDIFGRIQHTTAAPGLCPSLGVIVQL